MKADINYVTILGQKYWHATITLDVKIGNDKIPEIWRYKLQFNLDKKKNPRIAKEEVYYKGIKKLTRLDEEDKTDPARLTRTYLENIHINKEYRDIANFFESVHYLHIVPQLIREPDRSIGHRNDPYGGDFFDQILGMNEKERKMYLKYIENAMNAAVPNLKKIKI
ncbi:MAG: hypothetical protein WC620_03745 [Methanoregula sp.]